MKIYYLCSLALLTVCAFGADVGINESESTFETEFLKLYSSGEVEAAAAAALAKSEAAINAQNAQYNAGESPYYTQLNVESDVPTAEKEGEMMGAQNPSFVRGLGAVLPDESEWYTHPDLEKLYQSRQSPPSTYDASTLGLVTSVKNQQSCGSCAAFAATGAHETSMLSAGARFNGLDLSEQYIIDCGFNGQNMDGCGGADSGAYGRFFVGNLTGQSPHEYTYPYLNINPALKCPTGQAIYNSGAYVATAMPDYSCTEDKLATLVSTYGAAVSYIYASDAGFGNYANGVFNGCTSQTINHAVLVVGYGTDATSGLNYWKVKNSWGPGWGNNGYINIYRGNNQCGIGNFCYAAKSAKTTGNLSDPPPAPPAPIIPASQTCDMTKYWPTINGGVYTLTWGNPANKSQPFVSQVNFVNGIARPAVAGPSNCCYYICGKVQC